MLESCDNLGKRTTGRWQMLFETGRQLCGRQRGKHAAVACGGLRQVVRDDANDGMTGVGMSVGFEFVQDVHEVLLLPELRSL